MGVKGKGKAGFFLRFKRLGGRGGGVAENTGPMDKGLFSIRPENLSFVGVADTK